MSFQFNETPGQDFSHFQTKAIHGGYEPDDFTASPCALPISCSTTFKQKTPGIARFDYSRSGNPTREATEKLLAEIEGGKFALCYASGLAATDAVLHDMKAGDHILSIDDVYGGTQRLMRTLGVNHGLEATFVDTTNIEDLKKAVKPNTKYVWIETPTNPTMKVTDIKAAVEAIKSVNKNAKVVVDNTFSTPYFQRPLQLGADLVIESLTKYINGHCDCVMGSLATNDEELYERLKYVQNAAGAVPSSFDCYLVWRGIKTLPFRMRQHMTSGLAVAKFLESHPMVEKVRHPGLPSHPHHEVAKRQQRGYSGVFSFWIKGGLEASKLFLESVKVFYLAESLGGYESLIEHPALMTHASVAADKRAELGISDSFIRLSVGLEDTDDLVEDLRQALEIASKAK